MEQVRSRNIECVAGIHEAWNRRDWDTCVRFLDDHCMFSDQARGLTLKTLDEIREVWFEAWATAFPDGEITEGRYYDAGNAVVAQFVGRGTQTGPLGPVEPTGRSVKLPLCEVYHFGPDGRIIAVEAYFDQLTLLEQLGAAPQ